MCGIIGIIDQKPVCENLLLGLSRLEYRGYDSAGIVLFDEKKKFAITKAQGKLAVLKEKVASLPANNSHIGMGHTRWATHGEPCELNAHPIQVGKVTVVHNGIIENYHILKNTLIGQGYKFHTQTDTEVVAAIFDHYLKTEKNIEHAFLKVLKALKGAYALGIMIEGEDIMLTARNGSPLAIGKMKTGYAIGSDAYGLAPLTNQIYYLEDGDYAVLTLKSLQIYNEEGTKISRPLKEVNFPSEDNDKNSYDHYMLKEIFQQPKTLGNTLNAFIDPARHTTAFPIEEKILLSARKITIIACGTSYYAGMVARIWFQKFSQIPVEVAIASEYRFNFPVIEDNEIFIFISQSGETADTLTCAKMIRNLGHTSIGIINAYETSMARVCDTVLHTAAGPEIGVASTKAFTAQLAVLVLLALHIGKVRNKITNVQINKYLADLQELPWKISEILEDVSKIEEIAKKLAKYRHLLYMGRSILAPIAYESALKLKEITYIHAEGVAAGEIKHGVIALVDENWPVIFFSPKSDILFEKTMSNIQEILSRKAQVVVITDKAGAELLGKLTDQLIIIPNGNLIENPFLTVTVGQLLAYYTALELGTDIDQPRNLAKSVTVE